QVRGLIESTRPAAPLTYVAVSAALGARRVAWPLLAAGSGGLLGPLACTATPLGAAMGPAEIGGCAGRRAGRRRARRLPGADRAERIDGLIQRGGLWAVVGQRWIPGINDALASYTFGAFGVPLWQMAAGALIGSAPKAFVYTAVGSTLGEFSA